MVKKIICKKFFRRNDEIKILRISFKKTRNMQFERT